jgi:hypothetical protein
LKFEFFDEFQKNKKTSSFMKILPVRAEIFFMWADGQDDMTKLTVTFRNFANALRIGVLKASGGEA